ncbi:MULTISPECIES: fimbrial protein [Aeromonas]|uniref:fimbrial protein n=1 Tax=Aeromonas TaxID=642 RepID=UPI0030DA64F2
MMKKTTAAAAMLCALCTNVNAAPAQGSGTVNFVGAIVDAPCSITPESVDQTVQMGSISNATLDTYGESASQQFNIKLAGCALETAKSVDVTFNGAADNTAKDQLQLQGPAKGAAIEMMNVNSGEKIVLGKASNFDGLVDGSNTLKLSAKLVKTAADKDDIVPGNFTATTNFVLAYK